MEDYPDPYEDQQYEQPEEDVEVVEVQAKTKPKKPRKPLTAEAKLKNLENLKKANKVRLANKKKKQSGGYAPAQAPAVIYPPQYHAPAPIDAESIKSIIREEMKRAQPRKPLAPKPQPTQDAKPQKTPQQMIDEQILQYLRY